MLSEKRCLSDPGDGNVGGGSGERSGKMIRTYKRRRNAGGGSEGNVSGKSGEETIIALEAVKEHFIFGKTTKKCQVQKDIGVSDSLIAFKEQVGITSDESKNETKNSKKAPSVSKLCRRVLNEVLCSEKFYSLCKLLPLDMRANLEEFKLIEDRSIEQAYEQCPKLFSVEVLQVWRRLEKIGDDMASLSKDLAGMFGNLFHEQVGGLTKDICGRGHEKCVESGDSDLNSKPDDADGGGVKVCDCVHCGGKIDGMNFLACDSCDGIYHISCADTRAEDIPSSSNWYCVKCTASGVESPHVNCVVCDRLGAKAFKNNQVEPVDLVDLEEEESDLCADSVGGICKICQNGLADGSKLRQCGHDQCPHKFFHVSCLTRTELRSYGPRWYCPSCLCRCCLRDIDDEGIILCDSCDHAYHIYCVKPPLRGIPEGKWFCPECDEAIQKIKRARLAYEKRERETMSANKSVDILLSAAEKLKSQEI